MKILYDLTATQPRGKTKFHGGGEYAKTVFKRLCETQNSEEIICVFFDDRELDENIINIINEKNILIIPIKNFSEIDDICIKNNITSFYSALPIAFKKRPVNEQIVMKGTIHGLRGMECPGDKYAYKYYSGIASIVRIVKDIFPTIVWERHYRKTKRVIDMLDEFVCVSEHTKYSILSKFPNSKKYINVCYTPQKIKVQNKTIYEEKDKYLLLISANRWLKNVYRAVRAIDNLMSKGYLSDYKVKIVGQPSKKIISSIHNKEKFEVYDYVSAEELEKFYNNCELFIYPTLNEGFGMPPIEAMAYGKTCVISAICSLAEIYGDSVYYVNPKDIGEMETRILYAIENKILVDKVLKKEREIRERQIVDLDRVCEFIIGKNG